MEKKLNLLTNKKLIELAEHLGVSTFGTKTDIIERLETSLQRKNHRN